MNLFQQKKSYQFLQLTGFLCIIFLLLTSGFRFPERQKYKIKTIVIDAGHGGKDPGTHGKIAKEKNLALKVALETGRLIKANVPNVKVIYTRTTDVFVNLDERAAIANRNKADLFISIHCNANPISDAIYGTETYTMGLHKSEENLDVANRENAVITQEKDYKTKYEGFEPDSPMAYIVFSNFQSTFLENSLQFAQLVENQFKNKAGRKSRGVKQAGFVVLWKTTMPSVLVEIGYLSNATEEKYLVTSQGQSYMASAIYRAFKEYKQAVEKD
ncbi:MAG: N-acetylmuramoyl-L-alanine amidase [Verrucomicrobia bacterium]|nr:N-acetylmuramoyl-L-alanine amidase [Cytophagales bacterium]